MVPFNFISLVEAKQKNVSSLNIEQKGLPPCHLESWVYCNSLKSFIIWIWQVLTLCCELRTLTADSSQTRQLTALGLTQFTPTLLKGFMSVQRLQMRAHFEKASWFWTLKSTHTGGKRTISSSCTACLCKKCIWDHWNTFRLTCPLYSILFSLC